MPLQSFLHITVQGSHALFVFRPGGCGTPVTDHTSLSSDYTVLLNGKCNIARGKWDREAVCKTIHESLGHHFSGFKFSATNPVVQQPVLLGGSACSV